MSIQKSIKEKLENKTPKYSELLMEFIEDIDNSRLSDSKAKNRLAQKVDDLVIKEERSNNNDN